MMRLKHPQITSLFLLKPDMKIAPICNRHNTKKEWRATTFEYRDEGIVVSIPNIPAWVCPEDGEASFTPEITDELIATIRELVATRHVRYGGGVIEKLQQSRIEEE